MTVRAPIDEPTSPTCWLDVGDEGVDEVAAAAERFGLHELAVEDACHAHQRPKLEHYDDTMVIVAKPARYDDETESIEIGELFVAIGPGFIVTVRHGVARQIGPRPDPGREHELHDRSPIDVVYQLLDEVVDAYLPIVRGLQVDIEEIEADVFAVERSNSAPRIYALKRHVLEMRRNVAPLIEPLDELAGRSPTAGVTGRDDSLDDYFRDIADHARRLVDQLDIINDVLSDALQANLAQVSVAQNDDMRTMSAWAAIFLLPSLLAGVWGMNFESMPELDWPLGYPLAIAVMVLSSVGLWFQFRRSGWLGRHDRAPEQR